MIYGEKYKQKKKRHKQNSCIKKYNNNSSRTLRLMSKYNGIHKLIIRCNKITDNSLKPSTIQPRALVHSLLLLLFLLPISKQENGPGLKFYVAPHGRFALFHV